MGVRLPPPQPFKRSVAQSGSALALGARGPRFESLYSDHFEGDVMANVKQGNLTKSPQWWKHLKDFKRVFWKAERKAQQRDIQQKIHE